MEAVHDLVDALHHARPEDLPAMATRVAAGLGALDIELFLVDYGQVDLLPLAGGHGVPGEPVHIDGTLAGRAYTSGEVVRAGTPDDERIWVPVVSGADRLGVLAAHLGTPPGDDAALVRDLRVLAAAVGGVVGGRPPDRAARGGAPGGGGGGGRPPRRPARPAAPSGWLRTSGAACRPCPDPSCPTDR